MWYDIPYGRKQQTKHKWNIQLAKNRGQLPTKYKHKTNNVLHPRTASNYVSFVFKYLHRKKPNIAYSHFKISYSVGVNSRNLCHISAQPKSCIWINMHTYSEVHCTFPCITLSKFLLYNPSMKAMDFLPDTSNYVLRMCRECQKRFPRHRGLVILTCITARA